MFTGGAVLGDVMKDDKNFWLSKADWHELGPQRALDKMKLFQVDSETSTPK